MGGEWGLGAALAMESLPPTRRGFFGGVLQRANMVGFLSPPSFISGSFLSRTGIGARLFVIGALPALLISLHSFQKRTRVAGLAGQCNAPGSLRRPTAY